MLVKFNPTGTHIHKGYLKVRFDLYPDPTDKTYALHYVQVPVIPKDATEEQLNDQKWLDKLPKVWQLNPCLCHFVAVPETISLDDITSAIPNIFDKDTLATLDDALIRPDSIHLVSPLMRHRGIPSVTTIKTQDTVDLVSTTNIKLASLALPLAGGGSVIPIEPQSIDVGSAAIDRNAFWYLSKADSVYTNIDYNNAAEASGTIDTVVAYFYTLQAGNILRVGSFIDNGSGNFECHDGEEIGEVSGTGYQQYTGLTLAIDSGEFIGADGKQSGSNLYIDRESSGGSGVYYIADALCDPADSGSFSLFSEDILSLYGTGEEAGGDPIYTLEDLEDKEGVYYESYNGAETNVVARTDVTDQSTEERATTLTAFKADQSGYTCYQHDHHHSKSAPAGCTLTEV